MDLPPSAPSASPSSDFSRIGESGQNDELAKNLSKNLVENSIMIIMAIATFIKLYG